MTRLLIAASGTGGHLFPALAVAEDLPAPWNVRWLGVPDRLETSLVPERYDLITVRAGGLQGHGLRKLIQLLRLLGAAFTVRQLIKSHGIEVVFSTGGYIAAPAILGAKLCGIPVVLHESNAIPGRVTRLLGRFCSQVAVGLPAAAERIPGCQPLMTGTPVRAAFLTGQYLPSWVPAGAGPLLLVMGGSQGAVGLNRMVRAALPQLLAKGCRVVHLTGSNDPDVGQLRHPLLAERPFSDEIPGLLQHADLAISRAGAGSISELAVCGTPSLLVPFPQAADNHQEANAACAAEFGGSVIVHQHEPEHHALSRALIRLLAHRLEPASNTPDPLIAMRKGMEQLAVRDAEHRLAELLEELTSQGN
ncbi:UDP-N-acetylglucosamine--N-acetylmuramyl-(pentapeptide) pyrophosphoryl-undecaprenol N-acetylglucosamine transferase [Synechococcus sp. MIT S1220]|uniref:UDP-N-acetylglucosamine--N-acetylmuramyl- (pentapeptide) pyrophosphoryl-undecaprenol N-acetylglucosamine transferase n=1 Tax=Synechococcus sp. MIT S1220 TaxID=3082549 RepID=UPI0039B0BD3E